MVNAMDQPSFDEEFYNWHELSGLLGTLNSTVEEYAQYPTRGISRITDRSGCVSVEQKSTPLRIRWRDEDGTDLSLVKLTEKDNRVQEKQPLLETRLKYCPKTWQISEIKFYHDLPATATQIAWPTDHCAIVPISDSFASFPKLPTELRYMIWDYSLCCDPRDVKLTIDRRYRRPNESDPSHLVRLSCHIRQHVPIASKLPIALLYACQESHFLFLRKYSKMNMSFPFQKCDLKLRIVGIRRKKTANCEIRVGRKGYMDFRQDTLMIADFCKITGMLSSWNLTTLDLSLIQSIAVQHIFPRSKVKPFYGGKSSIWELLETRCPCLKRLSLIIGPSSLENIDWRSDQQAVARILLINAEFVDGITYSFQLSCQDEYARTTRDYDLEHLKTRLRTSVKMLARVLRTKIHNAQRTKSLYYHEVERNPNYWKKFDVNLAHITWVSSSFYFGEQMEKVIVTPPRNLQISMPDSYFWAQRPVKVVYNKPELRFRYYGFSITCHPDGSLLDRYEGVKEMFEGQQN